MVEESASNFPDKDTYGIAWSSEDLAEPEANFIPGDSEANRLAAAEVIRNVYRGKSPEDIAEMIKNTIDDAWADLMTPVVCSDWTAEECAEIAQRGQIYQARREEEGRKAGWWGKIGQFVKVDGPDD